MGFFLRQKVKPYRRTQTDIPYFTTKKSIQQYIHTTRNNDYLYSDG